MHTSKSIFTTPILWLFNILVARKNLEKKTKEEQFIEQQEPARRILEKLRFAQMMFDFIRQRLNKEGNQARFCR
jgi:hypothetical protein